MAAEHPSNSDAMTEGVHVHVESRYLPDQIPTGLEEHLFGYRITISNRREDDIRLLRRHWDIIDAEGHCEVIDGPGVIGQQPRIPAGESYSYGSFCPLPTEWGTMEGHYLMEGESGDPFVVRVARFHLFVPAETPVPSL